MKRPRFSEDEILQILQEHKSGQTAAELCRKYRISDTTFYKWRTGYSAAKSGDDFGNSQKVQPAYFCRPGNGTS